MEKKKRGIAKGKFTRQENLLTDMLDRNAAKVIVAPQYEKFVECWNCLEVAHDSGAPLRSTGLLQWRQKHKCRS